MNKILLIVFDIALVVYMFFAIGFSNSMKEEVLCNELNINMIDTLESGFMKIDDIEKTLLSEDRKILGYPIADINTNELEDLLMENPYLKNAEVYFDLGGSLYVDILQRKPLIRVITRSQNNYYLDREGYIFPERQGFTPFVLIANGYFTEGEKLLQAKKIEDLGNEEDYREWKGLLSMVRFISNDDFWKSQIVQLYFSRNGDFELIPRVGAHQIIFGEATEIEKRFRKLKILYNEGFKYEGWNNYDKINLKYNNQVICTKR